jgi:membrane-bound lytic murein transglycosylase F
MMYDLIVHQKQFMALVRHYRKIWLSWIVVAILSAVVAHQILPTTTSADDGTVVNPVYADLSKIIEKGKIIVLVEYGPSTYFIEKGQASGLYYDFFNSWGKSQNIEVEYVAVNSQREMFEKLHNGTGDVVAGYIFTDSRPGVAYTQALWKSKLMLLQRDKGEKVNSVAGLNGKGIWVENNSNHRDWLMAGLAKIGVNAFIHLLPDTVSTDMMARYILENKYDFLVTNPQEAERLAVANNGLETGIALGPTLEVALAVRNNAPQLQESLNAFIAEKEQDKTMAVWQTKYLTTPAIDHSPGFEVNYDKNRISPYDNLIREYAATINWDWRLLASLIYQESRFKSDAVGAGGAAGLMQLMPATARHFGASDVFDPVVSIRSGVKYIKVLKKMWAHIPDPEQRAKFVLASYNIGEAHVLDAVRLASKFEADPLVWDNNVELYLAKKTEKEYYTDPVVRYGYCNGKHACNYVRSVYDRYLKYKGV